MERGEGRAWRKRQGTLDITPEGIKQGKAGPSALCCCKTWPTGNGSKIIMTCCRQAQPLGLRPSVPTPNHTQVGFCPWGPKRSKSKQGLHEQTLVQVPANDTLRGTKLKEVPACVVSRASAGSPLESLLQICSRATSLASPKLWPCAGVRPLEQQEEMPILGQHVSFSEKMSYLFGSVRQMASSPFYIRGN